MSAQAVEELRDSWASAFEKTERTGPAWLRDIRERGMESFTHLGFPTTRNEDWRFTNVSPIARTIFDPAQAAWGYSGEISKDAHSLTFYNGHYMSEASAAGPLVRSLRDALNTEPALVERHLAQYADSSQHAFVALNSAFLDDGAFVSVPPGMVLDKPIYLVYASVGGAHPQVSHPRNLIVFGDGSQGTVVEIYLGAGEKASHLTNTVTEVVGGQDAVITHYRLQQEADNAFHISRLQVQQERGCTFASHSFAFGGALVRNEINSVLGEGAECTLNGLYVARGLQHVDTHTVIDHAMPHATSHELYKGILNDHSSAVFHGGIVVRKDAQKTDAKQTNKNLVLSENATINTKPQLQIYADDVRCTHGATVGQLDAEAIFYLRSRGIALEAAREMLIHAFASDIVDRVKLDSLKADIERILAARLGMKTV